MELDASTIIVAKEAVVSTELDVARDPCTADVGRLLRHMIDAGLVSVENEQAR